MEYVIDSSVIVKWFSSFNEEYYVNAIGILEAYKEDKLSIYIPELAIYEVMNALRYNPNFDENEVNTILENLLVLNLKIINVNRELLALILKIAYEDEITIYDAAFVAISGIYKIPLITANPKHHSIINKGRNVILLKDF